MMRRYLVVFFLALAPVALAAGPAAAAIQITRIQFDPPGDDNGSNASLNAEYVVLKNTGNRAVRLTRWTLRDTSRHVYRFPEFRLRPGRVVTIHTGNGDDTRKHLYWGSSAYIWNNDGDTATLKDANGRTVDRCRYSGSGSSVTC